MAKESAVGKTERVAISPAREAAFAILERVGNSAAHSDDLLHGPAMGALSQLDRNLATALVLGVLRWQIALDARLEPMLQRPELKVASPIRTALRLGAFQLLHMDRIPAHAALNESVELVRNAGQPQAAGMVNAVLRKLTREPAPAAKVFETTAALAARLSHPAWLVERWVKRYGRTAAMAICEYDLHEPAAGVLFRGEVPSDESPEESEPAGGSSDELDSLRIDDGSRLVAELAAASRPGAKRVWDCCAAPGGKTAVLAARQPEAELLATDVSEKRLRAMELRLRGERPGLRTLVADATLLPESEGLFDLILCDVPCSGTGTLARNPEIKERLQPADLGRQAMRQREILRAALLRLAPGGRLLYSTCSLEPEENDAVVEEVLSKLPRSSGVVPIGIGPVLGELQSRERLQGPVGEVLRGDYLRTLPGANFRGDGFFAALFSRA